MGVCDGPVAVLLGFAYYILKCATPLIQYVGSGGLRSVPFRLTDFEQLGRTIAPPEAALSAPGDDLCTCTRGNREGRSPLGGSTANGNDMDTGFERRATGGG